MKLKGKTIIELTDINTGEVTVIEDNNFITNAYRDMCQPILRNHDTMTCMFSVYTNQIAFNELMSGVLLFDSELGDNPDNYFPPINAKMVGHASDITYAGSDLSLGSYNSNLYESSETMRKFVWDFTSEQANGTIASVCLTTKHGGIIGYGTDTPVEVNGNQRIFGCFAKSYISARSDVARKYFIPLFLNFKEDFLVCCSSADTIVSTSTLTLHKIPLYSNKIDIFKTMPLHQGIDNGSRTRNYIGETYTGFETISVNLANDLGTSGNIAFAQDGKYLYVARNINTNMQWAVNTKIKIAKVNLEDFTYEIFEVTNTTGEPCSLFYSSSSPTFVKGFSFAISNGYMFVASVGDTNGASSARLYAINLDDNTIVHKVKSESGNENIIYGTYGSSQHYNGFYSTINGNVIFAENDRQVYSRSGNSFYPAKCVNASDFIARSLGTPYWGVGASNTSNTSSSSIAEGVFPTDNPLYFGNYSCTDMKTPSQERNFRLFVFPNVLMTINNLDTPVTKTSSQTMRITYTLTKEE